MLSDVVGDRIAEVRRQQGLSREDLAEACKPLGLPDMSAAVITNIETGRRQQGRRRREVTLDELVVIATALGVPPALLVYPVGAEEESELLGDILGDPWRGALWFCGESWPPNLTAQRLQQMTTEERLRQLARYERAMEPLALYRWHRELVRNWFRADRGEPDERALETRDIERANIELQLFDLRRDMRRAGIKRLPTLPSELAHVDNITPPTVRELQVRAWGDNDVRALDELRDSVGGEAGV